MNNQNKQRESATKTPDEDIANKDIGATVGDAVSKASDVAQLRQQLPTR